MKASRPSPQVAAVVRVCEGVVWESDEQCSALCPAHEDRSPSLRIGLGDDGQVTLHCFAGCEYADVQSALVELGVPKKSLRPAAKTKRNDSPRRSGQRRRESTNKPLPGDVDVLKWHRRLRRDEDLHMQRAFLTSERGLRLSTLMRYEVGHHYKRFSLPVRDDHGRLVNVRQYSRYGLGGKMLNWPGHGEATLYGLPSLEDGDFTEPVLLCEGELDALLAGQHGFVAVSGTGGAGNPPADLEPLRDRSVYIVYDCDEAGRAGARKTAAALTDVAKEVFLVDLGLGSGEDITDWFVTHERSADDLTELLDSADPFNEEDEYSDLFVTLADIEETQLRWLWAGRIPAGKLTMLEGDPGHGKSVLWAKIAAHVTTGEPFPSDGAINDASDVLVICAEDDLNDTIVPRLRAAGADLGRVHSMTLARDDKDHLIPLSIPEDLARLRAAIKRCGASLVIFDPVTAYLSESINSGNDASVRRALTPLAEIAQNTGAAVVLIRHLNKQGELKALYRGGGSIAFIGAARSGLIVDQHPEFEGIVVLAQTKSNLARGVPAITYAVESWAEDSTIAVAEWGDELDISAEDLLRKPDGRTDAPSRDEAVAFLRELLADGPVVARDVRKAASNAGIAWRTVERAKERAAVRTRAVRNESGRVIGWEWFIPTLRIVREEET